MNRYLYILFSRASQLCARLDEWFYARACYYEDKLFAARHKEGQ